MGPCIPSMIGRVFHLGQCCCWWMLNNSKTFILSFESKCLSIKVWQMHFPMVFHLCAFISVFLSLPFPNLPFVHTWWCWRYTHSWRLSLQIIIWTKHSFIAIVSGLFLLFYLFWLLLLHLRKHTFWIVLATNKKKESAKKEIGDNPECAFVDWKRPNDRDTAAYHI